MSHTDNPANLFGFGKVPTPWRDRKPLVGKYRGICVAINDPAMRGRIKAKLPFPFGEVETEWAEPCFPPGLFIPPTVNDGVWIEFEQGNPDMPIWVGMWYRNAEAPYQAAYDRLQQNDPEGDLTPEADAEHQPFHDHKTAWYTPHMRCWMTPTGHYILFDDWLDANGIKQACITIADRNGRSIVISEIGHIDIFAGNKAWVRLDEAGKVVVNSDMVYLGTEAGAEPLMTKSDADSIKSALDALRTHSHSGNNQPPTSPIPSYSQAVTDKVKGD